MIILQMRKLRYKNIKKLAHVHKAVKRQIQDLNSFRLDLST